MRRVHYRVLDIVSPTLATVIVYLLEHLLPRIFKEQFVFMDDTSLICGEK